MIGLLGKKIGMSQVFTEDGKLIPVSMVEAGPCPVVQVKTKQKDGYEAIQIGFGQKKRINKPMAGHLKNGKLKTIGTLGELKVKDISKYKTGDHLTVSLFAAGDKVSVCGYTKGRGFTGGMKRWGWTGGPATHGSMSHRRMGSVGANTYPGRVWKNKTMPGRYGNERVTIKNIKVVKIDKEKNIIYLEGAVPGPTNGFIVVVKGE